MNTIGIEHNLDRPRIHKLLAIGLCASLLTGVGDFLLGYAVPADVGGGLFAGILATAPNLSNAALVAGGLLGMVGIFLEGLAFFAIWRLMADAYPRGAHIFRAGIFFYIWLAPIGCHMNVGLMNLAYKYLWLVDAEAAGQFATTMYAGFGIPVYALLMLGWIPMIVVQWRAFARGKTPYPTWAKWFNLATGAVPVLLLCLVLGPETALGGGVGTMFLSIGNAVTFGGLLATLPSEARFEEFRQSLGQKE